MAGCDPPPKTNIKLDLPDRCSLLFRNTCIWGFPKIRGTLYRGDIGVLEGYIGIYGVQGLGFRISQN